VLGISDQFKIPVKYIGIGEKPEDLQAFDRVAFIDSLSTIKSIYQQINGSGN
jgi:fused signal recognition particle receptor